MALAWANRNAEWAEWCSEETLWSSKEIGV